MSHHHLELISHGPEETRRLGRRLGELAEPGDLILLVGNLGAGKTCLTQGIAFGLGIKVFALSPSFVLIREYKGRLPLYHVDFYRLNHIGEIEGLGLDDYIGGKGVCVIEWAEKGLSILPEKHLLINMAFISPRERRLRFEPSGARYASLVRELHKPLPSSADPL